MVCDDKWHSVVRVLFFILDEVFSVNTTCFVKTMVNARIDVTPLFQMTFPFPKPFFGCFVHWRSSGTDILYGCHLLLDV